MKIFGMIFGAILVLLCVWLLLSVALDAFEFGRVRLLAKGSNPYVHGWAAYFMGIAYFWLALIVGAVYSYYAGIGSVTQIKYLMKVFFLLFSISYVSAALIGVFSGFVN
jgi:hypothetical protein